eukprot:799407-Rhodomonas_salina.1
MPRTELAYAEQRVTSKLAAYYERQEKALMEFGDENEGTPLPCAATLLPYGVRYCHTAWWYSPTLWWLSGTGTPDGAWCTAMSGTLILHGGTALTYGAAMSSTDFAYGATSNTGSSAGGGCERSYCTPLSCYGFAMQCPVLASHIMLRIRYAMPDTDLTCHGPDLPRGVEG